MSRLIVVIIAIIFGRVNGNHIPRLMLRDYFESIRIKHMVVFACWDSFEKSMIFDKDILSKMSISYIPIRENLDMKSILKVNYNQLGVVLDLDCSQSETILEQFSRNQFYYNESFFWLMFTDSNSVPKEKLWDLPLTIASEVAIATRQKDTYVFYDAYNHSYRHGGRLNITYMGYWTFENRFINELTQYKYKRRQNFHGLTLNFSIVYNYPALPDLETYLTTPINRHLDTTIRFHYALVLILKDTYNFSINMMRAKTWGYIVNGSFNGLIGDMINGIVDISATPLLLKTERIGVCEYTVQTYFARPCFIFRHPRSSDIHNRFLKPFTEDVWWLVLIIAIIYWLLLLVTLKIELHYENYPRNCTLDTNPASETALITTAAVCQQGLSDGPRIYSGRIVFLSLFLWGLLLFQFYSASIVGFLLAEPPRFINTLKDLLESNLEAGCEDIIYNRDFFASTSDPVVKEFERRKILPNKRREKAAYFPPPEGLQMMQKGGFAFHVDIATAYKIIADTFTEDQICELKEVQLFPAQSIALITAKHSPFKKMVILGLRRTVEHGLLKHLKHVWVVTRPECPESYNLKPVPVALKEFSPALFSLLMGVVIAIIVMLGEMYIHYRNRHKCLRSPELVFYNATGNLI